MFIQRKTETGLTKLHNLAMLTDYFTLIKDKQNNRIVFLKPQLVNTFLTKF